MSIHHFLRYTVGASLAASFLIGNLSGVAVPARAISANTTSLLKVSASSQGSGASQSLPKSTIPATVRYPTLNQDLLACAERGDLETMKRYVSKGASLSTIEKDGTNILMLASSNNHTNIVDYLLTQKVDVNAANAYGFTALSYAAMHGSAEAAKRLLDSGANAQTADNNGVTPLMWASRNNRPAVVAVLLERNVPVDAKDKYENTALMMAADTGQLETVKTLLNAHADVNIKNSIGATALTKGYLYS